MLKIICWSWLAAAGHATTNQNNKQQCRQVSFEITASAHNRNITGIDLTSSLDSLVKFYHAAPVIEVDGCQTLAGTYCEPSVDNDNNGKLQVFFGSITADRSGWDALRSPEFPDPYKPDRYSWTEYANRKGYPTLTIDRLGTGKSSHPDPVLLVQAPYEIALYIALAKHIRAGTTGQLPQAYEHLIYIGNSYGSQLGAGIAGAEPTAFNEFILTGFSKNFQQDIGGVSLAVPLPAQAVDPVRSVVPTRFFGSKKQVDYENKVADLFFQRKDVVSVGQFVSIYAIEYAAPKFKGRLFVLNGEQDQAVCGSGSPVLGPAKCTPITEDTGVLFPTADYHWKTVNRVGHAIQLHARSQIVLNIAHCFLEGKSYKGGMPA
ncbi:alpha beta-hydrolase [Fusarium mundagurra]|uniref:Alpha beta-hydrolase n=1 Tax=Fusarium mundagurra TaxID=1567541 RepID=A0A8H5YK56_9HYPO|nr:alpha beta-hydrolase [Fusarium mundagurra]